MNIQNCSSCCQLGGIVRYSSYCLYLYHPDSQRLIGGQWISKNSMWSWAMGNYKLDVHRSSLDRAQVSSSVRSVFIRVFAFDLLGNPEGREVTSSAFFPHLQNGNTLNLLCEVLWDLLMKHQAKELSINNGIPLKMTQPWLCRWSN